MARATATIAVVIAAVPPVILAVIAVLPLHLGHALFRLHRRRQILKQRRLRPIRRLRPRSLPSKQVGGGRL